MGQRLAAAAALLMLAAADGAAQSTTSNIQGLVRDETGVLPGATVTARETQSGFQHTSVTSETGEFALAGLRPGSYEITVLPQYKPQSKTVQLLLGQTVTANFIISPDLLVVEQVLTQNYKAEYEKASSAVITAVTKSGGNTFHGDIFNLYQDKHLAQSEVMRPVGPQRIFARQSIEPKPTYERWQWGASLGGPIVKDKVQFFATYEENRQDRENLVTLGSATGAPQALTDALLQFEGVFLSPFRERLLFSKMSSQPRQGQQLEVTYSFRNETDIRSFGAGTSYEAAENVRNRVDSVPTSTASSRHCRASIRITAAA